MCVHIAYCWYKSALNLSAVLEGHCGSFFSYSNIKQSHCRLRSTPGCFWGLLVAKQTSGDDRCKHFSSLRSTRQRLRSSDPLGNEGRTFVCWKESCWFAMFDLQSPAEAINIQNCWCHYVPLLEFFTVPVAMRCTWKCYQKEALLPDRTRINGRKNQNLLSERSEEKYGGKINACSGCEQLLNLSRDNVVALRCAAVVLLPPHPGRRVFWCSGTSGWAVLWLLLEVSGEVHETLWNSDHYSVKFILCSSKNVWMVITYVLSKTSWSRGWSLSL